MRRATRFYFSFFAGTLLFFSLGAGLPAAESGIGWEALLRFLLLGASIGCAAGAWGTAVMIASVHKVTWPLVFSTGIVLAGGLAFAVVGHRAAL